MACTPAYLHFNFLICLCVGIEEERGSNGDVTREPSDQSLATQSKTMLPKKVKENAKKDADWIPKTTRQPTAEKMLLEAQRELVMLEISKAKLLIQKIESEQTLIAAKITNASLKQALLKHKLTTLGYEVSL